MSRNLLDEVTEHEERTERLLCSLDQQGRAKEAQEERQRIEKAERDWRFAWSTGGVMPNLFRGELNLVIQTADREDNSAAS